MIINDIKAVGIAVVLCGIATANATDTWMLEKGALLFEEDFSAGFEHWEKGKSRQEIADGVLNLYGKKGSNTSAGVRHDMNVNSKIIEFSFRFNGADKMFMELRDMIDEDKREHGPAIAMVPGAGMYLNIHKKGPYTDDALLGECAFDFKAGEWYTMVFEIHGDELLAYKGDEHFVLGKDARLARDRNAFTLIVKGEHGSWDNIKVWEGTPKKSWPKKRKTLAASQAARSAVDWSGHPHTAYKILLSKVREGLIRSGDAEYERLIKERGDTRTFYNETFKKTLGRIKKGQLELKEVIATDEAFRNARESQSNAIAADEAYVHSKDPQLDVLLELEKQSK